MKRLILVSALFIIPAIATAGDIYKCTTKDGKVEYSQTPCETGKVETAKIQTTPTSKNEAANAKANLNYYRSELQRRETVDRAAQDERARASQNATAQRNAQESAKREQQFQNEKVTVHTDKGWDRKTRAEVIAEEKRKAEEAKTANAIGKVIAEKCYANASSGSSMATIHCDTN